MPAAFVNMAVLANLTKLKKKQKKLIKWEQLRENGKSHF